MQDKIFIQQTPKSINLLDESFLDLDFAFDFNDQMLYPTLFQSEIANTQDMSFQPLDLLSDYSQYRQTLTQSHSHEETPQIISNSQFQNRNNSNLKSSKAQSLKTKNICFNICQKTIKVLKTRVYNEKLKEFCKSYKEDSQQVIIYLLKIKKDLTGPKALEMFVHTDKSINQIFKNFMKWFLEQKYLRHAINEGTMDDLKGYLQFKNQVIMDILEKQ